MDRIEVSLDMCRDCPTENILAGPISVVEIPEGVI
jgi:hypothetical protein